MWMLLVHEYLSLIKLRLFLCFFTVKYSVRNNWLLVLFACFFVRYFHYEDEVLFLNEFIIQSCSEVDVLTVPCKWLMVLEVF